MKTWRIKIRKTGIKVDVQYDKLLRRVALARLAEQRESGNWTMYGVFGAYVEGFEKRFHGKWRLSQPQAQLVLDNLRDLVRMLGKETDVIEAIEAVFTLKWVHNSHDRFLLKRDNHMLYLLPAIVKAKDERKPAGEQSEWEGPTWKPGEKGSTTRFVI